MRSTFSGMNMALLGMNASQRALDVTGQNLTNINTSGYTRQRLDLASISPTGADYFNTRYNVKVGQGVLMTGVSQIRDPFLDIQFRNQLSRVGSVDAKNQVLTGIGDVFDNVDVTTVQNALDDVVKQMQTLSTKWGRTAMIIWSVLLLKFCFLIYTRMLRICRRYVRNWNRRWRRQ